MVRKNFLTFEDCIPILCCPSCKTTLSLNGDTLNCGNSDCKRSYPIVGGRPVLINEKNSIFSISDYLREGSAKRKNTTGSKIKVLVKTRTPKLYKIIAKINPLRLLYNRGVFTVALSTRRNFDKFTSLLFGLTATPIVLILGCGSGGKGMEKILSNNLIKFVNADVSIFSYAAFFSDAHDIPLKDRTFDGVIVQAVLEHVINPQRCVDEIHRVLKDSGIVYSELPFMQQVHEGRYDFTRFTHLGHRVLFRMFREIESGLVAGPGTSLAWAYHYFLKCISEKKIVDIFARITGFWLKYFDYLLKDRPGALDAASCTYFLGMKSDTVLPNKDILSQFRRV